MPTTLVFQTNDMFDKEIFSKSLCTSAFVFSSSTASVHLFHQASIPWSFLSLPWFFNLICGYIKDMKWSCFFHWMFQWNTTFMFKALDLILWMRWQGSVFIGLSDKTSLWKKLSGGGERSPTLGKTLRISSLLLLLSLLWVLETSYHYYSTEKLQSFKAFLWTGEMKIHLVQLAQNRCNSFFSEACLTA